MIIKIASSILVLFPAIWFLTIVFSDCVMFVRRGSLVSFVSKLFLRAAGWNGHGSVEVVSKRPRLATGVGFFLCYGYFIVIPFGWIFQIQAPLFVAGFLVNLLISGVLFIYFTWAYCCSVAYSKEAIIVVPCKFWEGRTFSPDEFKKVEIKNLRVFSILYAPCWNSGKLILFSKKKLEQLPSLAQSYSDTILFPYIQQKGWPLATLLLFLGMYKSIAVFWARSSLIQYSQSRGRPSCSR